jgi:hypothetical protein
MNTCSTCKYWGDGFPVRPDYHNTCGKIGIDEQPTHDIAYVDVQVADDTSLNVEFKTMGHFGCTLHSPKQ